MNKSIYNTQAKCLKVTGCGQPPGGPPLPVAADSGGRMILSPELEIDVQSGGLNTRPLSPARDSVLISDGNLDIRALLGSRDAVKLFTRSSAFATQTEGLGILSTVNMLTTDTSRFGENAFIVYNTSGISVGVNVTLQLAPANIANYFTNDGTSFSLLGGNTLVLIPGKTMKFARVQVS